MKYQVRWEKDSLGGFFDGVIAASDINDAHRYSDHWNKNYPKGNCFAEEYPPPPRIVHKAW